MSTFDVFPKPTKFKKKYSRSSPYDQHRETPFAGLDCHLNSEIKALVSDHSRKRLRPLLRMTDWTFTLFLRSHKGPLSKHCH